jgi:8-oxo-dGTP pyrophosphatase MutT (NUDIX family)
LITTFAELKTVLERRLPGVAAQQRMGVHPRLSDNRWPERDAAREGAVLVLFYPASGQLWLPLMLRTQHVADHKGQISLPGGQREPGDASFWHTALREAGEEVGIDSALVRYAGALTPHYIAPSHFVVYPFVGWADQRPDLSPNSFEVSELFELPVAVLFDPHAKEEESRELYGQTVRVPFYKYKGYVIWGATAMILSELEAVLHDG